MCFADASIVAGRCLPKAVTDAVNLVDKNNGTVVIKELEAGIS
jgi:hypothetical protein